MAVAAKSFRNFIGSEWVDASSGETFESVEPATGEVIGSFPKSGAADVDRAVAAAKEAYDGWRLTPAPRRAEILYRFASLLTEHKDELTELMTREMGKVLAEAGGDVQEAIDMSLYMAGEGRRLFGHTTPSELPDKFMMSVRHADRRRRRDHAVELPDRDPVLEARAGARLRQHGRAQARRATRRCSPSASSSSSPRPGCRRASSTSSTASARRSARRSCATRTSR